MVELELIQILQSISYIAGALGVCIAAIYYVLNMRITLESRQAQIYMPLFSHSYSETYMHDFNTMIQQWQWKNVNDFFQKYMSKPDEFERFGRIFAYYEGIGVLVKNKLIDPRLVDDQFSFAITSYWEKYHPILAELQRRTNAPELGEYIELLYNRVKRIRDSERSKSVSTTMK